MMERVVSNQGQLISAQTDDLHFRQSRLGVEVGILGKEVGTQKQQQETEMGFYIVN